MKAKFLQLYVLCRCLRSCKLQPVFLTSWTLGLVFVSLPREEGKNLKNTIWFWLLWVSFHFVGENQSPFLSGLHLLALDELSWEASSEVGMTQHGMSTGCISRIRNEAFSRKKHCTAQAWHYIPPLVTPVPLCKNSYHISDVYLPNLTDRLKPICIGPQTYANSMETQIKVCTIELYITLIL